MPTVQKALSLTILDSLELDLCRRSPSAALGFISAMLFILFFPVTTSAEFYTIHQIIAVLSIISCGARIYCAQKIIHESQKDSVLWRRLHFYFIVLNALSFGLIFSLGIVDSQSTLSAKFTIFLIMGSIISASTTTLSLIPRLHGIFILLVGFLPVSVLLFINPSDPLSKMWVMLLCVFGFYNYKSSKYFFWNSVRRYQFEESLMIEKKNLNETIKKLQFSQQEVLVQKSIAEYSAKLAALGEMAGGIAHEINNPLNIILLLIEKQRDLLERTPGNITELKKDNEKIETTINRISKIISGLRSFARSGQNDPIESSNLQKIIEDTLSLCHERFKNSNIELKVGPFPPDLTVKTRPVQLSQVLLNLLNNAFEAVEGFEKKWISVAVTDLENKIQIRVIDCGFGIPESIQDRLFVPFFTTKDIGKGTGLGLSISKGLIESHHGKMYYESSSTHTSFVVELEK